MNPISPDSHNISPTPSKWIIAFGAFCGFTTLIFFMILALYVVITDSTLSCNVQQMIIIILSFGSSLSFAFIGGYAAAKGSIPIPLFKKHPISFSVGGGIAVLIIILVLGSLLFPCNGNANNGGEKVPQSRLDVEKIYRNDWMVLKSRFSNRDRSIADTEYTKNKGPEIARQFLAINDRDLNYSKKIVKYQYAAYSYIMAAVTENDNELKKQYAEKGIENSEKAQRLLEKLKERSDKGIKNAPSNYRDFIKDLSYERIFTLIAWGNAILAQYDKTYIDNVKIYLNKIEKYNQAYHNKYPYKNNTEIAKALSLK